MACLYKRRRQFWISYYVDGKQVQKSLHTSNERIARTKKKRIEYELALGDLHIASKTKLPAILEAFCKELMAMISKSPFWYPLVHFFLENIVTPM